MEQFDTSKALVARAECIVSLKETTSAIIQLAEKINAHYGGEEVIVWSVLNGALVFTGQLLPHLSMPLRVDYVHATRYHRNTPSETVHWAAMPRVSVEDRHLLICDDIFDAGFTLKSVEALAREQGAKSIATAVMAFKERARDATFTKPDFIALQVPDRYVFGMGMDFNGYWRNAPGIWVLP